MRYRPADAPCPKCQRPMPAMMAAGGWAPPGFEPAYDHYWCEHCVEAFDFDEVPPPTEGRP